MPLQGSVRVMNYFGYLCQYRRQGLTPAGDTDTSTRNNSLRELILARALFRCGDVNGLGKEILTNYSKDLRGHYYRHASGVLKMYTKLPEPKTDVKENKTKVNPDFPEIKTPEIHLRPVSYTH